VRRYVKIVSIAILMVILAAAVVNAQFHLGDERLWFSIGGGFGAPQHSGNNYLSPRYGVIGCASFAFNPFSKFDLQSGVYYFKSIPEEKTIGSAAGEITVDPNFEVMWFSQDIMFAFSETGQSVSYGLLGAGMYRLQLTE